MSPLEVAARFAAFVWYTETLAPDRATQGRARRFARDNWPTFLPVADEGWGRLLLRLARAGANRARECGPARV